MAQDTTGSVPITDSMRRMLENHPLKGESLYNSDRIRSEFADSPSRTAIQRWIHKGCTLRRTQETVYFEVLWVGADRWVSSLEAVVRFLTKINEDGGGE